jgi:hypothetical protein
VTSLSCRCPIYKPSETRTVSFVSHPSQHLGVGHFVVAGSTITAVLASAAYPSTSVMSAYNRHSYLHSQDLSMASLIIQLVGSDGSTLHKTIVTVRLGCSRANECWGSPSITVC